MDLGGASQLQNSLFQSGFWKALLVIGGSSVRFAQVSGKNVENMETVVLIVVHTIIRQSTDRVVGIVGVGRAV